MKIKHCFFTALLIVSLVQPAFAKCELLLGDYLKNPRTATAPGMELDNCQLALAKIVAVHPDVKPRASWGKTGTLELSKIESTGKSLPKTFTVPYQQRGGRILAECETWDDITLKTGERLLAFIRPENKGWAIPELAAGDVVIDMNQVGPAFRKQMQPLFRTRL